MENNKEKEYWEAYYRKHRRNEKPSPFALFVENFLNEDRRLLELGCGNGRDSIYFSKMSSLQITALDQCEDQVSDLERDKFENINFKAGDFTNYIEEEAYDFIYSRFTLHSINSESEKRTFKNSFQNLKKGGLFFIEVRSIYDELMGEGTKVGEFEFVTDHYRRFVKMDEMIQNGIDAKLNILYSLQSKDLAPYKTENPIVIRLIFQKPF